MSIYQTRIEELKTHLKIRVAHQKPVGQLPNCANQTGTGQHATHVQHCLHVVVSYYSKSAWVEENVLFLPFLQRSLK